jgi:hypothetical protein
MLTTVALLECAQPYRSMTLLVPQMVSDYPALVARVLTYCQNPACLTLFLAVSVSSLDGMPPLLYKAHTCTQAEVVLLLLQLIVLDAGFVVQSISAAFPSGQEAIAEAVVCLLLNKHGQTAKQLVLSQQSSTMFRSEFDVARHAILTLQRSPILLILLVPAGDCAAGLVCNYQDWFPYALCSTGLSTGSACNRTGKAVHSVIQ